MCVCGLNPSVYWGFCLPCHALIRQEFLSEVCYACGLFGSYDNHYCKRCGLAQQRFEFDALRSPFAYRGYVKQLVLKMKKSPTGYTLVKPLSMILFKELGLSLRIKTKNLDSWCVMGVPLLKSKLIRQGFHPTGMIADNLAFWMRLSHHFDVLKCRDTGFEQKMLSREARLLHVKKRFFLDDGVCLKGRSVLLIDDVVTTLATVNVCASLLKSAGASIVWVLALAQTLIR
jgi:ComF family protein